MPYAPGIQDISGQLLAQGMQQRAQGFASGFTNFIAGMEQNKRMTNDALAKFQGAVAANPNLLQFLQSANNEDDPNSPRIKPEIVKAFSDIQQGKTDIWNTALVANFAESFNKAAAESQMLAYRKAETDRLKATADFEKLKMSQIQAEMDADKTWRDRQPQGAPGAGPTQPAPQQGMAGPLTFLQGLSQQVPSYGGGGGASQGVPPSLARFAGPMAQTAAPQAAAAPADMGEVPAAPQPDSAQEQQDPFIIKAATALGRSPQNRSALPQIRQLAQNYRQEAEKRSALARRQNVVETDYNAALQKVNALKQQNTDPNVTFVVEPSETAGGWLIKQVLKSQKTPTEEKSLLESQTRVKQAEEVMKFDRDSYTSSRKIGPSVARLESMFAKKELDTGELADVANTIRSYAKSFGYTLTPQDEAQLATGQTAKALFGNLIVPLWAANKGNTTNKEQEMFQSWNPNLAKSEGANKELLGIISDKIKLDRKIESLHSRYIGGKLKGGVEEYMDERQRLLDEYDSNLPTAQELSSKYSGSAALPSAAGPITVTSQAQYDALPLGTQYRDSQGNLATKKKK